MAVSRSKPGEIPTDAVIITEDQALQYQWKIVTGWDKLSDVWSIRFSAGVLGALSAVTSIYVNSHYRKKLRLGDYGKFSSYLPIVVIPAMFSMLTHRFFVQRPIMLGQVGVSMPGLSSTTTSCPLCVQLRASAFQSGLGVIYPTLLAPFGAFMFATRHFTYRLPSITEQPMEVVNLYRRLTKPIVPVLGSLIALHAITAMFLTYRQTEDYYRLQLKLQQIAQEAIDYQ